MDILYHYTTMQTFYSMMEKSILEEKYLEMWATNSLWTNDSTELQLFKEYLMVELENYAATKGEILTEADKTIINDIHTENESYIISLSEKEDNLTMWRGYGQNGNGISLGFDFNKIDSPMADLKKPDEPNKPFDSSLLHISSDLNKCRYNSNLFKENIVTIYRNLKEKKTEFSNFVIYRNISLSSPIYKHPAFIDEGEWRIIKKAFRYEAQYRMTDDKILIPYIKIKIPISCLTRIIIGPCANSSGVVERIKQFAEMKITHPIEVSLSQIPYRNRL